MFSLIDRTELIYTARPYGHNSFNSEKELGKLADSLKLTRIDLEAIWNNCAGKTPYCLDIKPVKKFRNRPYGVKQIWKVTQRLVPKKKNPFTKREHVTNLMRREEGASGDELMKATGWKPHTVRGFVSTLQSQHGLKINGTREERGMVYRISA